MITVKSAKLQHSPFFIWDYNEQALSIIILPKHLITFQDDFGRFTW